jgi:DNA-directed RNA polymerase specialized sigma24 family protein
MPQTDSRFDREAFHVSFYALHAELFCLLSRRFPVDVAEEAAQHALFQAWTEMGRDARLEDLMAWLCTVATRAAQTAMRRQNARTKRVRPLDFDPAVCPFEEFDRLEEQRVLVAAILRAVDRIPADLAALFKFCTVERHTYREAEDHFSMSHDRVTVMLRSAREVIRLELRIDSLANNRCDIV